MTNNGTPYTDEAWKAWYNTKSSSELAQEEQERIDLYIDDEIEARERHHYGGTRR